MRHDLKIASRRVGLGMNVDKTKVMFNAKTVPGPVILDKDYVYLGQAITFRALLELPQYCSASEIFTKARTYCFQAIIRNRVGSLMQRVCASTNSLLVTVSERIDGSLIKHFTATHVAPSSRAAK